MERVINLIFCLLLLFSFNLAYAEQGCCSRHGGVKGCNTATNHQLCNDGTTSDSCLCSGGTADKDKSAKGCCSKHGGVAGCSRGHTKCKDGTVSETCKC